MAEIMMISRLKMGLMNSHVIFNNINKEMLEINLLLSVPRASVQTVRAIFNVDTGYRLADDQ